MSVYLVVFIISLTVLFYTYLGYGLLTWLLFPGRKKPAIPADEDLPEITLLIPAYNEESVITQKLENSLGLHYPEHKLKIVVIADGSTDKTVQHAETFKDVNIIHQPERLGKYNAIKTAILQVQSPVVVFTDANCMLNTDALVELVRQFADKKTGAVAGEKKIQTSGTGSPVGQAEGLYWQYESFIKRMDDHLYTVIGAAGELFAIRRELFEPTEQSVILDDFIIAMQICLKGYRIAYAPEAYAMESPSRSLKEEQQRKQRIAAGDYQAAAALKPALNFFRYPVLAFQYWSRRILRWYCCPPAILLLLVSNIMLVMQSAHPVYSYMLIAQLFMYVLAITGWWLVRQGKKAGLAAIPFYFLFMNYCLVRGFILYLRGKQPDQWEKAQR